MSLRGATFDLYAWIVAAACLVLYGFWQIMAALYGLFPLSFAKYFVIVAAGVGAVHFYLRRMSKALSGREILTVLLLLVVAASVVLQLLLIPDFLESTGRSPQYYLVAATAFNFFWLLWGYMLQAVGSVRKSNAIAFLLLAAIAILIYGALDGSIVLQYWRFRENTNEDSNLSHLTLGASTYLILLGSYALASGKMQLLVFLVSLPVLFALGGRADVGIYIISVAGYEWFRGVHGSKFIYIIGILALMTVGVVSLPSSILEGAGVSRMVFEGGIEYDDSYAARYTFLLEDIRALPDQALVGDVVLLVRQRGSVGTYIHNLLSAWQFYGLPAFGLIAYLLLSNFNRMRRLARNANDAVGPFGVLLFFSAIVGVIVAKAVTYPILWLALGYCASSISFRRIARRIPSDDGCASSVMT